MSPAQILSSVGNSEVAYEASRMSQPGYGSPAVTHLSNRDVTAMLIQIRDDARGRREYKTADALRDVLLYLGVKPRDAKE